MIKRVKFILPKASLVYTALGGVRFYKSENEMLDSGSQISSSVTSGETQNFITTATVGYAGNNNYYMPFPFDVNKPQLTSVYTSNSYWLADSSSTTFTLTVEFKTPIKSLYKIEFVPRPDGAYTNRGVDKVFSIEILDEKGSVINQYDITPITQINTVQTFVVPYKNKILLSSGDKHYSLLNDGIQETTSIPKMTRNTSPEGEVLVSNTPNGNATFGWEAFDGGLTTSWGGNALPTTMPKWIGYKFIKPKVIVKYRLYVTNTTYYPRNYEFQGSNDGINYDTLHSIVGGASGVLDYVIPNRKSYTHYRLYITSLSTGATLPSIMELQMFEMKPSYLVQMESATETDFLNCGAGDINDFNQNLKTKKNLIKGNTVLSSGKTFEHTVDMSKRRVDKITLG